MYRSYPPGHQCSRNHSFRLIMGKSFATWKKKNLADLPHDDHLVLGHHGLGLNPLDRLEAHRTDDSKSYNKGPENGYVPSNRHNRCYNG